MGKRKPKGYWTYENCKMEVIKNSHKTRKQFQKENSTPYKHIIKNRWNDLLNNLTPVLKNINWTYEDCLEVSSKYNNITSFRKDYGGAYQKIRVNNWTELYDHMEVIGDMYKRLIYVYEFEDNHCYVGLTYNIERRNWQHKNEKGKSAVFSHMEKTGFEPNLVIKTGYLDINESILMEKYYYELYKSNGWYLLNRCKTGSTGSSNIYWTKEKCIEESKKYESYSEFRKKSKGALNAIAKNNWYYILEENIKSYKKRKSPNLK